MKKLRRTLALFLALVMALSMTALAADDEQNSDGPKLVLDWLDWDDQNHCFASEEALSPENPGDPNPAFAPGGEDRVLFSVLDGEKKTPVSLNNLKSKGVSLKAVDKDEIAEDAANTDCYVILTLDGWDNGTVTTTYSGKTLTCEIRAELPGYGFYTEPKFDKDTWAGWEVDLLETQSDTFYFGSWCTDEDNGWHLAGAQIGKDGDPGFFTMEKDGDDFWKITVDREAIAESGWGSLQVNVTIQQSDGEAHEEEVWISFSSQLPPMWVRWVDWDEQHYVDPNGWFGAGMGIHPGEQQYVVFYAAEKWDDEFQPIDPKPVKVKDLKPGAGVTIAPLTEDVAKNDPLADYYAVVTVDEFDKRYSVSYNGAVLTVDSYLPDIALYSAPERTTGNYVLENVITYGPGHMNEVYYILSDGAYGYHDRAVDSLALAKGAGDNLNDLVALEKTGDGVYSIRLKDGIDPAAPLNRERNCASISIVWKNENGDTWTDEGYYEVWFRYNDAVMASEESILDGTKEAPNLDDKPYGDVADKLSNSVTMTAGEDKSVYLTFVYVAPQEDQKFKAGVTAFPSIFFGTSDDALKLTVDSVDGTKYTLSCDKPGEYEIGFIPAYFNFVDKNGKVIPEEDEAAVYEALDAAGVSFEFRLKEDAIFFYDLETGEEVEALYDITLAPKSWDNVQEYTLKVIVEDDTPISERFSDVAEGSWYVNAVKFITRKGLMIGDDLGRFNPNNNISGAEFVTIMHNIAQRPAPAAGASFAGLDTGKWYADKILWAAGEGLITDSGDAALNPDADLTREEMIVILYNMVGENEKADTDLSAFPDVDEISPWALDAVKWAVGNDIIHGMDGKLVPTGTTRRSEVAQMLMGYYS